MQRRGPQGEELGRHVRCCFQDRQELMLFRKGLPSRGAHGGAAGVTRSPPPESPCASSPSTGALAGRCTPSHSPANACSLSWEAEFKSPAPSFRGKKGQNHGTIFHPRALCGVRLKLSVTCACSSSSADPAPLPQLLPPLLVTEHP